MNAWLAKQGTSAPLGATVCRGGVNFSVFSKNATELLLFDNENAAEPANVIPLDPLRHRTYHYWHAFVSAVGPGQVYGYRGHGPSEPENNFRFDGAKVEDQSPHC